MIQKIIIFDASTLITLVMNGLTEELRSLKKIFSGKFIITNEVKKEIVDKPITIDRFKLEALRLKQLIDEKILEMPVAVKVKDEEISKETNKILSTANNIFIGQVRGNHPPRTIKIIDLGEASCLALSKILTQKGIENILAVDERTTRMLGEKPENLQQLLERKLRSRIDLKEKNFEFFKGFNFIRSAELVYVANKKGLVKLKNHVVLDALLYAVKFKGCAISMDEIKEMKRLNEGINKT